MHKCTHCSYTTTRLHDLHRHQNRKTPCFTSFIVSSTNTNPIRVAQESVTAVQENVTPIQQSVTSVQENVVPDSHDAENDAIRYTCSKCNKILSCKQSLQYHQKICNGINNKQCPICKKVFANRNGIYKHKNFVKCKPPPVDEDKLQPTKNLPSTSSAVHIINNTTNNTTNTTNNTNNNTFNNITINFGEEVLEKLCSQPDYLKRMEEVVRLGKYALPQHISDIYFNESFPMNNTIVKTRHNDRFVKIKTGINQWDLRVMDDIYKTITERMETYMTPYFHHVEKQLGEIYDRDRAKFKRMTRSIREFGHKVLWLDWKCDDIRQIGVELNDPYCENERNRRIQEMKSLLLEHFYDKTREILSLKNAC